MSQFQVPTMQVANQPSQQQVDLESEGLSLQRTGAPVQTADMLKMLREYISDNLPIDATTGLPDARIKKLFAIIGKSTKLSFLQAEDIPILMADFHRAKLYELMGKPEHEFSFDDLQNINQLEINFLLNLKRSQGSAAGIMNERTAEVAQVSQVLSGGQMQGQPQSKKGILKTITGWI